VNRTCAFWNGRSFEITLDIPFRVLKGFKMVIPWGLDVLFDPFDLSKPGMKTR